MLSSISVVNFSFSCVSSATKEHSDFPESDLSVGPSDEPPADRCLVSAVGEWETSIDVAPLEQGTVNEVEHASGNRPSSSLPDDRPLGG